MTTKAEQAEAERKVMARYEARLAKAYAPLTYQPEPSTYMVGRMAATTKITPGYFSRTLARTQLRILRASAAAVIPGDQRREHLLPALGEMVTAACRVIRGGAK